MMHWPVSGCGDDAFLSTWAEEVSTSVDGAGFSKLALQGVNLSDKSTPRSRASCSNVIGMKDPVQSGSLALMGSPRQGGLQVPTPQTTNTSAAQP